MSEATVVDFSGFSSFEDDSAPIFFPQYFVSKAMTDPMLYKNIDLEFWEHVRSNDGLVALLASMILSTVEADSNAVLFEGISYKSCMRLLRSKFLVFKVHKKMKHSWVFVSLFLNFSIYKASKKSVLIHFRDARSPEQTHRFDLMCRGVLESKKEKRFQGHRKGLNIVKKRVQTIVSSKRSEVESWLLVLQGLVVSSILSFFYALIAQCTPAAIQLLKPVSMYVGSTEIIVLNVIILGLGYCVDSYRISSNHVLFSWRSQMSNDHAVSLAAFFVIFSNCLYGFIVVSPTIVASFSAERAFLALKTQIALIALQPMIVLSLLVWEILTPLPINNELLKKIQGS